ncbi:PREDICTED: E3 ubiquitin-protein ligase Praja-2, partial [Apaloderma vittatum]|uniref:E3 ubiquitin-protein ligase Praja-2 n=1 Tax=Apaloderma vittatum TaxID=57397 RepID=UPI000521B9EE
VADENISIVFNYSNTFFLTTFYEGLSPLVEVSFCLLDEPLPINTETGELVCQSVSSQTSGLESNQISGNPYEDSEELAEYASGGHCVVNGSNGIDVVNSDSKKSDGKSREKDDAQIDKFLATEESDTFQETLDNAVSEHDEEIESFTGFEPQLSALSHGVSREFCQEGGLISLMRHLNIGSDLACANNSTFKSSTEGQTIPKSNPSDASCETQHIQDMVGVGIRSPLPTANELVVRRKIRSENTANHMRTQQLLHSDGGEGSGSWRTMEALQGYAEHDLRKIREKMSSGMLFHSKEYKGPQKNKELDLGKNAAAQEQKQHLGNSSFKNDSEDHHGDISISDKHDSCSSECSDGECFEAVPSYPVVTKRDQLSNNESWPIVPVMPKAQSTSSDKENEAPDFCFQEGSVEEGEVPCSTAQEEPESSSDEEELPVNDLMHSSSCVLFMWDGDNNSDDDSSMSEGMDLEWSLIDEAADSLGLRYPQYLAFMAVGGNTQQAME